MTTIIDLEKEVMQKILDGHDDVLKGLRTQYALCKVTSREKSEVGCFINYKVPHSLSPVKPQEFVIGDVFLELINKSMDSPIGFILFVKSGYLSFLEIYTYEDDLLPNNFTNYRLFYNDNDIRDLKNFIDT